MEMINYNSKLFKSIFLILKFYMFKLLIYKYIGWGINNWHKMEIKIMAIKIQIICFKTMVLVQ